MDQAYVRTVVESLRARGIALGPGLTDAEIARIEAANAIRLPPDLRALVQSALPEEGPCAAWRDAPEDFIARQFAGVLAGIRADIARGFWPPAWGAEPETDAEAGAAARAALAQAPTLIPVFAHRFLPAEPHAAGNPVFSIHGTDSIIYGNDLADYLAREFGVPRPPWAATHPRVIPIWTQSLDWGDAAYWRGRAFAHDPGGTA